jgi:DnaJ family protein C protein 28
MSEGDPRPARKGESAIEKQIRQAIERGEFDHLAGAGKPLDLSENPFTPAEWRMAYKMLQDAGMAPDWIEQDKEIRREVRALDASFKQQAQWQHKKRAKAKTLALEKIISEREHLARVREQTIVEYCERATALNKIIDLFNLKAPSADFHRQRIRIEEEIRRFQDACEG